MCLFAHACDVPRCLIVRTALYDKESIAKVIQLRANVEDLKLGDGVLERLAQKGSDSSLRYVDPGALTTKH